MKCYYILFLLMLQVVHTQTMEPVTIEDVLFIETTFDVTTPQTVISSEPVETPNNTTNVSILTPPPKVEIVPKKYNPVLLPFIVLKTRTPKKLRMRPSCRTQELCTGDMNFCREDCPYTGLFFDNCITKTNYCCLPWHPGALAIKEIIEDEIEYKSRKNPNGDYITPYDCALKSVCYPCFFSFGTMYGATSCLICLLSCPCEFCYNCS